MGGVLLVSGPAGGLPHGRLDWRGREALLRFLNGRSAQLELEDLERLLFAPWRERRARRRERGREASWEPHLRRLRRAAGVRTPGVKLLGLWFRPYGDQLRPLPGARQALAELGARGLRLAVVSNVPLPGRLYREVLGRLDLVGPIRSFQFSYDAGSRKPSPAMLRAAMRDLGVLPHETLMVGDRRAADVAAGRAAGVRTVWIEGDDGGGPEPDHRIRALPELLAWI